MTGRPDPSSPLPAVRISAVLPAHNEQNYLESAVKGVVAGLRDRGERFEVLISENGSTDGTVDEAERIVAAYPEVRVLRSPVADYGAALRRGFENALGDLVVNFDVDLVDLGFFDRAVELMVAEDAAIVVGSKRLSGATDQRGLGRKVVTAVFGLVLRHGFGLRVSDTHGLKVLRRVAVAEEVAACQFGEDIFDTEVILRCERAGLRVLEIPVAVADQRPPRTPIARRIPRSLIGLVRLRAELRRETRRGGT
jgi:glycosyltransferase AglD